MQHSVIHDPERRRFLVRELGHEAYLEYYELPDGSLDYSHTYTPNEIRGRGIATAIIRQALEYARTKGKQVIPSCPFVQTYADRHREYAPVIAERWRHSRDESPSDD